MLPATIGVIRFCNRGGEACYDRGSEACYARGSAACCMVGKGPLGFAIGVARRATVGAVMHAACLDGGSDACCMLR